MFGRVKFIFFYAAAWLAVFALLRLLFVVYQLGGAVTLTFRDGVRSLLYGLRMDGSMTAYITLPVCLFLLLGLLVPFFRRTSVFKVYTGLVLFAVLLIATADLETYKNWNFRLDATPLKYLSSPAETAASVSHLPYIRLLTLFMVLNAAGIIGFNHLISRLKNLHAVPRYPLLAAALVLVCAGLSVVAMRGGLQLAPMNQSAVYFSSNNFANHAAINAPWNFMQGVLAYEEKAHNPYRYMLPERAKEIGDSLHFSRFSPAAPFRIPNPNIILVIWESFTEKALHLSVDGQEVVPHFNRYRKEGLYFSNMYASGDRTDKGLSALLSGYPALPKNSILRDIKKAATLPFLSHVLQQRGYVTPFYYGGETEFANIKSYLLEGGFSPIIQKKDFSKGDQNSKWGAHDGVVAARLSRDLRQVAQPFFATWLTLTSHEPFETPVVSVFSGRDDQTLFLNSLHYTDAVLNDLVNQCKKEDWWSRTVLIIVGDHGHRLPDESSKELDFRIPMLWLGGALSRRPYTDSAVVSQLDLATTVAGSSSSGDRRFLFSHNLFDTLHSRWAFFSFNDGWGLVQPGKATVFDNVGKRAMETRGPVAPADIERGKALQQYIYQDFLDR